MSKGWIYHLPFSIPSDRCVLWYYPQNKSSFLTKHILNYLFILIYFVDIICTVYRYISFSLWCNISTVDFVIYNTWLCVIFKCQFHLISSDLNLFFVHLLYQPNTCTNQHGCQNFYTVCHGETVIFSIYTKKKKISSVVFSLVQSLLRISL